MPSCSAEISAQQRALLLALARSAIQGELSGCGLEHSPPGDPVLSMSRGAFVTLSREGCLRGCIGIIETGQPLEEIIPYCATGAAFRDPRFTGLTETELAGVQIEISLLSPPTPLQANSREHLLSQLEVGEDGLILEQGQHRATFLPQVWEQLPDPDQFLERLLLKAGLPRDHWSGAIRWQRYRCDKFSEADQLLA